jgi:hypothetical protein
MALREFFDEQGNTWRVWDTRPTSRLHRPEYASGWLTFEEGNRRRRLPYIPDGWVDLPEAELHRLCAEATSEQRVRRLVE